MNQGGINVPVVEQVGYFVDGVALAYATKVYLYRGGFGY